MRRLLDEIGASTDDLLDALIEEALHLAPLAQEKERHIAREVEEERAEREGAKTA